MIKNILNNKCFEIDLKENCLHLINYINVIDISPNKMHILLNNRSLVVNGSNLIICALDENELLIKGNIKGIEFIDE
ncbi:MAG: YabP/YqfC family sporulation protein [Bacilli bacterium]|nr:YabP/YqfC family sporulation protein [Bacilli bacterium]